MKLQSAPKILLGALIVFCAGVWSLVLAPYFYTYNPDGTLRPAALTGIAEESSSLTRVAALLAARQHPLGVRTKTSGCAVDGPLPDAACTPGSVFANASSTQVCVPGYTTHMRSVSTTLRKKLYAAYATAYPPPRGTYELDHLVPLALGGDNSAANLFPEAAAPKPGFKEKDAVEIYLHEQVCAGRLDLRAAQAQVAADWVAVYRALDPADIARIKQKYTSWAN